MPEVRFEHAEFDDTDRPLLAPGTAVTSPQSRAANATHTERLRMSTPRPQPGPMPASNLCLAATSAKRRPPGSGALGTKRGHVE